MNGSFDNSPPSLETGMDSICPHHYRCLLLCACRVGPGRRGRVRVTRVDRKKIPTKKHKATSA